MRGVGGGFFFHTTPFMKKLHFTPASCLPPFANKMQKKTKKNDNLFCRLLLFLIVFLNGKLIEFHYHCNFINCVVIYRFSQA